MRVLITGAAGNLGAGLAARLAGRHDLLLADVMPMPTAHPFVQLDVRVPEQYVAAARGVDLIVHAPAWHGIHLESRSEREFWELNVNGTFNLFQAAVAQGVPRVVWISSMAVHRRGDIYGFSKLIGEELCQFYFRAHGIRSILLRPGGFTPYSDRKRYGEDLLRGGVDPRDVYQAAALAVENDSVACDAFPVTRADPWTDEEIRLWPEDPAAVLEHYVARARHLVARYQLQLPQQISAHDISATRNILGYQPEHNFLSFLAELAARDAAGDAASWLAAV